MLEFLYLNMSNALSRIIMSKTAYIHMYMGHMVLSVRIMMEKLFIFVVTCEPSLLSESFFFFFFTLIISMSVFKIKWSSS